MNYQLFKIIAAQGIFAILFTYLLLYILKENSKREDNYQKILKQFSNTIPIIKKDIEIIKNKIIK